VVGFSTRFNSGAVTLGRSAWMYDAPSNATVLISPADNEHLRDDGYRFSDVVHFDDAGRAVGYAERYNQGSLLLGQSVWTYSLADPTTRLIALRDAAHTRGDGYRFAKISEINAAGIVLGESTRFAGADEIGESPWLYDPTGNATYPLLFSSNSAGQATTDVRFLTAAGAVIGNFEKFHNNISLGLRAFYWARNDGLFVLDGETTTGAPQVVSPVGIAVDGSIYGSALSLDSGGQVAWRSTLSIQHWLGDGTTATGTWSNTSHWSPGGAPTNVKSLVFDRPLFYTVNMPASSTVRAMNIIDGNVT
jgi:hypothetical protein